MILLAVPVLPQFQLPSLSYPIIGSAGLFDEVEIEII